MKWKYVKFGVTVLIVVILYILVFESKRPAIMNFVTVTNNQLTTLKNFKYNLEKANEKFLRVDNKYLIPLGFGNETHLYPEDFSHNITLPIIVTYAMSGKQDQAVGFAKNVAKMLPGYFTFMYNIGLKEYELFLLQNFCKSNHCTVINFEWDKFPAFVKQDVNLFRPIIIQDALNKVGVIFYVESNLRFVSSDFSELVEKAQKQGVLVWRGKYPISAITHPRIYDYFKTEPNKFYFVPSVDPTKFIIYNIPRIHYNVMLPWIKCTLVHSCVYPIGSQDAGCQFDKKPLYRYSGCHKTGTSAISIILGLHFNFSFEAYTFNEKNESLFNNISEEDIKLELSLLVKNSTDFKYN